MKTELEEALSLAPNNGSVYLLEKLTDVSGFFCSNGQLLYVVKNYERLQHNHVDTEFLSIKTHLYISSIKDSVQYKSDFYNLIVFKGTFDDVKIASFIHLCRIHSAHYKELGFWEFFYALTSLFKPLHEQKFKNLLGLWGELAFIREVFNLIGRDISADWHRQGSFSKYDFTSSKANIEVKTVISEVPAVTIKHSQIFNNDDNFLCAVCVEENEFGETLTDLILSFRENSNCFNSLSFNVNVERELQRVSTIESHEKKFKILSLSLFDVSTLNNFSHIPFEVDELQYKYDLSDSAKIDIDVHQERIW